MDIPGVGELIGKLGEVLANEASLIWGAPDGVKDLMEELESIQAFLIDHADQGEMQTQFAEEVEKKRLSDIRDKAYEAEDIIDEFTYHMNKHHHDDISCLYRFLHLLVDAPKTLRVRHQTAHKLQKIKKSITDIAQRHKNYKAGASTHDAAGRTHTRKYRQHEELVKNLRERACFIEEKSIIGFHKEIETVKQWLLMDTEPLKAAISVFGMGGAGKTTLISRIYENQKGGFEFSEWITVSQTYTVTELLKYLIGKFGNVNRGENESYRELVKKLRGCLSGKRYLIVLDDVWDTNLWEQMKVALPEDGVGSRILVTTRDERHAPSDVKSYKLPIGQLQGSEPWDLFSMKAFADCPNKTCPPELYSLARELVDKCRGLPLALVTLGGHMSSKKQKEEWIDVYDRLYKNPAMDVVKSILKLSYNDLPYSLQHCFLYCCLFPEDYPIKRKRLIRRWIAEGFVEGRDKKTPEEEADLWLSELVFRSMLLVETKNVSGRPKVMKMHDVMRDFALEIAKKEKFCGVCDGREAINEFEAYRWSILFKAYQQLKLLGSDMTRVRSLTLCGSFGSFGLFGNTLSFSKKHLHKFKMLRLLDMEDKYLRITKSELPHEIWNLFNLRYLRYLRLRGYSIKKLPSSIGRLLNLQTLDISVEGIFELPKEVGKLRKLRHLIMRIRRRKNVIFGIPIAFDISKLNKLQVLIGVHIVKGETLRQLGTLTQLTRLDMLVYHDGGDLEERRKNWEALGQLKLLQGFTLHIDVNVDRDIEDLIILPLNLKKIHLKMFVGFQSRWFDSLHNIQRMTLIGCAVDGYQLNRIAALENLVSLELKSLKSEEVLHFCGSFAKLKQLSLIWSGRLKKVIFEKGAMPHMESLSIIDCYNLQELPEGIEHLTSLQKLELLEVPERLKDSYEEGIKNWKSKVQHIPTIDLSWK